MDSPEIYDVLGGSQFTRCTPLSKREAKIKKSGPIFLCEESLLYIKILTTNLMVCKPAF